MSINEKELEKEIRKLISNLVLPKEDAEEKKKEKPLEEECPLTEDEEIFHDRAHEQWLIKYFDGLSNS